jgi:hypothetical protein
VKARVDLEVVAYEKVIFDIGIVFSAKIFRAPNVVSAASALR